MLMNGSILQIAQDLKELEKLGVDHVNLVFDFGKIANDLEKKDLPIQSKSKMQYHLF